MKKDSLGNRMKDNYESRYRFKLTRRMPVIIRLDGKAFHTLTKQCDKPFDTHLRECMGETAYHLCESIQGAKCAYVQSDEISILLTDFDKLTTDGWFDYNLQKIVSISASIATVYFNLNWKDEKNFKKGFGFFDSRAFNIPKEEVCNYFIWRQQDWIRNSVQMLAQSLYSHKELHKKNVPAMHDMIHDKGKNWAKLDSVWKNGTFVDKINGDFEETGEVIFNKNRNSVERYLEPMEE